MDHRNWRVSRERVRSVIIQCNRQRYSVFENALSDGTRYYTAGGSMGYSIDELRRNLKRLHRSVA